jgi:hypothetical protein
VGRPYRGYVCPEGIRALIVLKADVGRERSGRPKPGLGKGGIKMNVRCLDGAKQSGIA